MHSCLNVAATPAGVHPILKFPVVGSTENVLEKMPVLYGAGAVHVIVSPLAILTEQDRSPVPLVVAMTFPQPPFALAWVKSSAKLWSWPLGTNRACANESTLPFNCTAPPEDGAPAWKVTSPFELTTVPWPPAPAFAFRLNRPVHVGASVKLVMVLVKSTNDDTVVETLVLTEVAIAVGSEIVVVTVTVFVLVAVSCTRLVDDEYDVSVVVVPVLDVVEAEIRGDDVDSSVVNGMIVTVGVTNSVMMLTELDTAQLAIVATACLFLIRAVAGSFPR